MTKPEQQRHSKKLSYRLSRSEKALLQVAARYFDQEPAAYVREAIQHQLEREGLFDPPPSRTISFHTPSLNRLNENDRIRHTLFLIVTRTLPPYDPSESTSPGSTCNLTPARHTMVEQAAQNRGIGKGTWLRYAIQQRLHIEGWTDPIDGDAPQEEY